MLVAGAAGAQVTSVLFYPLITRLFGPETLGVLGTFTAVAAMASSLAALAYPLAIVLPRNDRDAIALARVSFFISILLATFLFAALFSAEISWPSCLALALLVATYYLFLCPCCSLPGQKLLSSGL